MYSHEIKLIKLLFVSTSFYMQLLFTITKPICHLRTDMSHIYVMHVRYKGLELSFFSSLREDDIAWYL
jgi:hypothetical protein